MAVKARITSLEVPVLPQLPAVEELRPTQRKEYETLRAMSREAAKHKLPDATSDHNDMYDAFGLPK